MDIGSATLISPTAVTRLAPPQPVAMNSTPDENKPEDKRQDSVLKVDPAQPKPVPAAVGKGIGLLVDISL